MYIFKRDKAINKILKTFELFLLLFREKNKTTSDDYCFVNILNL